MLVIRNLLLPSGCFKFWRLNILWKINLDQNDGIHKNNYDCKGLITPVEAPQLNNLEKLKKNLDYIRCGDDSNNVLCCGLFLKIV
jgi:hypothetical protein